MTATPFSYINDDSVDLNEVCLHITYLFLKELAFVSDVFLLALLSHENCIHCQKWYQESFHWNDSCDTAILAVSSTHLIYSLMSFFFICLFIFFVIVDIFFFKSIAWNLLSRIPYSVSVILFPFPDSRFRVLVLPRILFTLSAF